MTEISNVKNAAVRLRAIYHNKPVCMDGTPNDGDFDRILQKEREAIADVELELAMIAAGMMTEDQAIAEIVSDHEARKVLVTFDDGQTVEIRV